MLRLIDKSATMPWIEGDGEYTGKIERDQLGYLRNRALVGYFDSPLRFMDHLDKHMAMPRQEMSSSKRGEEGGFNAFRSYEEAMDTFRNKPSTLLGFKESENILTDGENAGIGVEFEHQGDFLDIGRYLEGEPECFGVMIDGNPRGRRVNLIIGNAWVHYTEPDAIIARSRRIQRLVDWLENQQIRTSILAVESHNCCHLEVLVKDHDAVLDMRDVAIVSHPEFLRRLTFRFDEYSPSWSSGYGNSLKFGEYVGNHPEHFYPDMDNEITVFIGNNPDETFIEKEFDGLEKWLTKKIPQVGTDPEKRFKIVSNFNG